MSYLFGDSDLAARRLTVLARVFREPTRSFLSEMVRRRPSLTAAAAVDLGCGPGSTTHLLAETLGCRKVVGLDNSRAFIDAAKETSTPAVSFYLHDVTTLPMPVDAVDLIYSRHLLAHLPHPVELATRWMGALQSNGLLLLEESEYIETEVPAFVTYLGIVAAMLRDASTDPYVGSTLDRIDPQPAGVKCFSRLETHPVPNRDAATLFSMNLPNWRESTFVRTRYPAAQLDELHAELQALARSPEHHADITWGLRQIAFERTRS